MSSCRNENIVCLPNAFFIHSTAAARASVLIAKNSVSPTTTERTAAMHRRSSSPSCLCFFSDCLASSRIDFRKSSGNTCSDTFSSFKEESIDCRTSAAAFRNASSVNSMFGIALLLQYTPQSILCSTNQLADTRFSHSQHLGQFFGAVTIIKPQQKHFPIVRREFC